MRRLILVILVATVSTGCARDAAPRRPARNLVLVTIDTLRADALSSYGGPAQTPHLDALAAHGARFTFAHAHSVVTLPSHTTILSGQPRLQSIQAADWSPDGRQIAFASRPL